MSSSVAAAPLIGRDEELARLTGVLDRARAGTAGAVLIAGDAGVGKTRVLDEVAGAGRGLRDDGAHRTLRRPRGRRSALPPVHRDPRGTRRRRAVRGGTGRASGGGQAAGRRFGRGPGRGRPAAALRGHRGTPRRPLGHRSPAAGPGGPALGRPVLPRPAPLPAQPGHPPAPGGRLPHPPPRGPRVVPRGRPPPPPSPTAPAGGAGPAARRGAAGAAAHGGRRGRPPGARAAHGSGAGRHGPQDRRARRGTPSTPRSCSPRATWRRAGCRAVWPTSC